MTIGHTPGPWRIVEGHGQLTAEITAGSGGQALAKVWTKRLVNNVEEGRAMPSYWPEGMANARLIAVAPRLLTLLTRIANAPGIPLDELPDTLREVREAIFSTQVGAS